MSRRSSRPAAFIAALFLTFTLAIAPNASQAQERQPVARVVAQVGPVTALSGSEPRSLHLSAPLFEGEHVVTGPNAKVQLELADGSRLSLGAGTRVATDFAGSIAAWWSLETGRRAAPCNAERRRTWSSAGASPTPS